MITKKAKEIDNFKNAMSLFRIERNKDVQNFLRNTAFDFEIKKIARTYLLVNGEAKSLDKFIAGFFTIAIKPLTIKTKISNSLQQKIFGFKNPKEKQLAVYLLGQLGRNDLYNKTELSGKAIIDIAHSVFKEVTELIGGRIILVECENNEKIRKFYEKNSYGFLQPSPKYENLIQMIRVIK